MELNDTKRKLNSINWNFDFNINYPKDSLFPFDCRKHFSYPATFIPEIPYSLIEILSKEGDTVLDPFGGIGTTFVQALLLQRNPISCDINPVAANVCSSLYRLFDPLLNRELLKQQLLNMCENYVDNEDYSLRVSTDQRELAGWFEKETFNKICYLISQYDDAQDEQLKSTMIFILSSMISMLSSQNKGWAYIADNVKPKNDEYKNKAVFEIFKAKTKLLFADIENHLSNLTDSFKDFYLNTKNCQRVFNASIVDVSFPQVDLIVTSPPYPKMIDYVKSQRISLALFNEDYNDYVEQEIGARCHRSQKKALENYSLSMEIINKRICEMLKPKGYFCIVLPDYPHSDVRKPVMDNMIKSYENYGLEKVLEFCRYIPSNRRTLSIQWASLVREKILVFRKES